MVYTLAVQFEIEGWGELVNDNENPLTGEKKVQMLADICSRHGSKIRSFYIYNARFDRPENFSIILNSMPLLEKFNAMKVNLNFTDDNECFVAPTVMKHLKKLQVSMTGFDFRYLNGSRPKIVSLINLQRNKVRFLNEFVQSLEHMQTLTLVYNVAINMFLESEKEFKFKLKELKIEMSQNNDIEPVDENQIIDFFPTQALSLKQLTLRNVSGEVLKASLHSFPLLEKLDLYACTSEITSSFSSEKRFYDCLQQLTNLRELIVHNVWNDEEAARGILSKCSALVKLQVTGRNLKIVDIIARSNPNIEQLKLCRLLTDVKAEMQLKLLKSFHLTSQDGNEDNLIAFIRSNPTIERLVIERLYIPEQSVTVFLDTLLDLPNLKNLELTSHHGIVKNVYDRFSNSENQRSICAVLGIELTGLGSFVRQMGPRKVTFKFPEDAGQWDAKLGTFIAEYKQKIIEHQMKIKRCLPPHSLEN